MLKKLKLSTKLILGFSAVSVLVLAIGGIGLYASSELYLSLQDLNDNNLVPVGDVSNANMQAIYHNRGLYDVFMESDPQEQKKLYEQEELFKNKMMELINKYRATKLTPPEEDLLKQFDTLWPLYAKESGRFLEFLKAGKREEASAVLNKEATDTFQKVDDNLSALVTLNVDLGKKTNERGDALYSKISVIIVSGIVFSFFVSIGLGLLIARKLSSSLSGVAQELTGAGEQTASASTQLSSASQLVSSGTTESASSLEETVAAIEELTSMVSNNAKHAREAAHLAKLGSQNAVSGNEGMKKLVASMDEISQSSKKIEDIIVVIDDISFQINLLALNAAVEAARAGDHGKGFAVVADAVRTLAQKSANAAKDISTLIKESVGKTDTGSELAFEAAKALEELSQSVQKTASINEDIASASEQQAAGISQISKAMQALDSSTQQNAASAEEIAASAEEMSAQAQMLQGMVVHLREIVNGEAA